MKAKRRFIRENEEKVEASQKAQYASYAASQWLELRLQLIGCAIVAGIAILVSTFCTFLTFAVTGRSKNETSYQMSSM